ncbi:MAG: MCE family protein [Deltaproteobacteria bacterium]|nr:MCE family protein [Deltaproteobacteria bacterium]
MARESERKREVVVGLFVLAALGVAAFMVVLLGSEQRIFQKRFSIRAVFGDVSGLRAGAPVFVGGLTVGAVERLRFVPTGSTRPIQIEGAEKPDVPDTRVGEIEVVMRVEESYRPQIRKDSIATIGSVGLLGDKSIEISVGTFDQPIVEPGDVLSSVEPLSLSEVMDELQPMAKKLDQILGDISVLTGEITTDDSSLMSSMHSLSEILQKVDRGEGTIGRLVNSPTTANELDRLLTSARQAVGEIRLATVDLPPTMASVRQVAAEVEQLSVSLRKSAERFPAITADLEKIAANLSLASDNLPSLSVEAEQGVRRASDVFEAAGNSILLRGGMPGPPERMPVGMSRSAPAAASATAPAKGGASAR